MGEQVGAVPDGGRRQPAEPQREDGDQEDTECELRYGVEAEQDRADEPVDGASLVPGGQHAEADCRRDEEHDRRDGEQEGRAEAVAEVGGYGPPRGQRDSEVAVEQPGRPVQQPFVRRPVQVQGGPDRLDPFRVRLVTGEGHGGVAGQCLGEGEDEQHDGRGLHPAEQQPPRRPGQGSAHASHTLSKRAQSRVLAGACRSTPRTVRAVPSIQSAKPQIRKGPSVWRRRCMRA